MHILKLICFFVAFCSALDLVLLTVVEAVARNACYRFVCLFLRRVMHFASPIFDFAVI